MMEAENLMVCIADLGLAIRFDDQRAKLERCGTPSYVDPSVLLGQPFSAKSDIFSLGSVMFNLITKRLLFKGMSAKEVLYNNAK